VCGLAKVADWVFSWRLLAPFCFPAAADPPNDLREANEGTLVVGRLELAKEVRIVC